MVAKECKYCGRMLEWDASLQTKRPGGGGYVEVANGQAHKCPNYKPENKPYSGPQTNSQVSTLLEIETKLDALTEKFEGFFEAWTAQNSYKKATEL